MLKEILFAIYSIKKNIQSSAELRASFLMNIVGMAINNCAFIILWIYFIQSVGVVGGWTSNDIIGLQGFVGIGFGCILSLAGGLRYLADSVSSGVFDQFMLSPKNLLIRVATSKLIVDSLGDILFGVICLSAYIYLIDASVLQLGLILILLVLSTMIVLACLIFIFSVSFFFTDADPIAGCLFEAFLTPSLFHGGAFQGGIRFIFSFVIPSLMVGTIPVEIVKNPSIKMMGLITVLAVFWLWTAIKFFNYAVKRYESSNFIGHG